MNRFSPCSILLLLLCIVSVPARADLVAVAAPQSVSAGTPFSIRVTLTCPPPSEAPPLITCSPGATLGFYTLDGANFVPIGPATGLYALPGQSTLVSGLVLQRPGPQAIRIAPLGSPALFLGATTVVVQAAAESVPAIGVLGRLGLMLGLLVAGAAVSRAPAGRR